MLRCYLALPVNLLCPELFVNPQRGDLIQALGLRGISIPGNTFPGLDQGPASLSGSLSDGQRRSRCVKWANRAATLEDGTEQLLAAASVADRGQRLRPRPGSPSAGACLWVGRQRSRLAILWAVGSAVGLTSHPSGAADSGGSVTALADKRRPTAFSPASIWSRRERCYTSSSRSTYGRCQPRTSAAPHQLTPDP